MVSSLIGTPLIKIKVELGKFKFWKTKFESFIISCK